jgi:hypothetical protein
MNRLFQIEETGQFKKANQLWTIEATARMGFQNISGRIKVIKSLQLLLPY